MSGGAKIVRPPQEKSLGPLLISFTISLQITTAYTCTQNLSNIPSLIVTITIHDIQLVYNDLHMTHHSLSKATK